MNGFAVWLLWIGGFALLGVASLTRLLTWRGRLSAVSVSTYVVYLLVSLVGVGGGLYQLFTTSPAQLAAPIEGALLVQSVAATCVVVFLAARELYIWSSLRLTSRGAKLITQERYAQALQVYERLRRRRMYRAIAWSGKASALQALSRSEEALTCADEALRLTPQDARSWMVKGQALLSLRRDTEALEAIEQGVALAPQRGTFLATQGVALFRLGRLTEARAVSERAVAQLEESDPDAWRGIAQTTISLTLTADGRAEEALALAEHAVTLGPRQPRAYLAQALALEQLGRMEEMRAAAEQGVSRVDYVLSATPERTDLVSLQAQFLHLLGREQETGAEAQNV